MRWYLLACILLALAAGCPKSADRQTAADGSAAAGNTGEPLSIWADPALAAPLEDLADEFAARHAPGYTVRYMERGELLGLLEDGQAMHAPHAYIIADPVVYEALRKSGAIDESSARTFAGDRLAVVHREGENWMSPTLFDIYRLRYTWFGVGEQSTSAGYYSEQALVSEGVRPRIEKRIKSYGSTKTLLEALAADEVQLAMVYTSTAAQAGGIEVMLIAGEDLHEDIRYRVIAAAGRGADAAVGELLRFLAEEDEVQAIFNGYGLLGRKSALMEDR
ncbi:substrate-binding domain-containing protein [bacterium]|nr:substrate-binding domain-containing protein [bacterium]